uniref:C-type lectin lectoxin-Thr1 n=1 Tax=Thrasops jacksonii TaxID=186611 RepID=LECM_THRJA|nr:RecName: Full=C-type lectin lectoxin-Thr1; Short=CTL; Flags: Precursor [Thrasops jacksonii]ABU68496.1 Lectoxin-Thr1 [Thrasops jacksonii]
MGRFIFATLGLLLVAFSINGAKGCCCPHDWLTLKGFCYKVFNEHKTWNDAEMFCRKYKPGCHLASIHSGEESTDLAEYVSDYLKSGGNVWIGLNDPQKKRSWQWTDRSQNNFYPWKQGEPNNRANNENCVELWSPLGYKNWNDESCASTRAYLCKCRF